MSTAVTVGERVLEALLDALPYGADVVQHAAQHDGTTLQQIYGRGVDVAEGEAAKV